MAAKKSKSRKKHSKKAKKAKSRRRKHKKVSTAETLRIVKKRLALHEAAAARPGFTGGHLPIKSGCGRPRKRG